MQISDKLKQEINSLSPSVITTSVLMNNLNITNLIASDFSDFVPYQGAVVTRNKTFPIDVFKGGRNLAYGFEFGSFNYTNGVNNNSTEQVRSQLFDIEPNTKYIFHLSYFEFICEMAWVFYNSETSSYVNGYNHNVAGNSVVITTPDGVDKMKVRFGKRFNTINIPNFEVVKAKLEKGDIATEYSPAPEDGYGLDLPNGAYHIETQGGDAVIKYGKEIQFDTEEDTISSVKVHAFKPLLVGNTDTSISVGANTTYDYESGHKSLETGIQFGVLAPLVDNSLDFIASNPMITKGNKPKYQELSNLITPPTEELSILTNPLGALPIGKLEFDLGLVSDKQYFDENDSYEVKLVNEYLFEDGTKEIFNSKTYKTNSIVYDQATGRTQFVAYDSIYDLNKPFEALDVTYPITYKLWVKQFLLKVGLEYDVELLNHYNFILDREPNFLNVSNKQVLEKILEFSLSFGFINDDDNLSIMRLSTLNKEDYDYTIGRDIKSFKGRPNSFKTLGINRLVLGLIAEIDGENVSREDTTMIATDDVVELRINDIPFAYDQDTKLEIVDAMFSEIKGFRYNAYESESKLFYMDMGSIVHQEINDNGVFGNIPILSYSRKYHGSIITKHEAISESYEQTQNAYDKFTPRKRTEIKLDKINQEFEVVHEKTDELGQKYTKVQTDLDNVKLGVYSKTEVDNKIENIELTPGPKGDKGDPGLQGIPGKKGEDGKTTYTWIKFADTPLSGMSDNPSGKDYMGLAPNKDTPIMSLEYSDYVWTKTKGDQGVPGESGDDGIQLYTWVKYADTPTSGMSDDAEGKLYVGLAYNKEVQQESLDYEDYEWAMMPQNIEIGATNLFSLSKGWYYYNDTYRVDAKTTRVEVRADNPTLGIKHLAIYKSGTMFEKGIYSLSGFMDFGPDGLLDYNSLEELQNGNNVDVHRFYIDETTGYFEIIQKYNSDFTNVIDLRFNFTGFYQVNLEYIQFERGNLVTDFKLASEDMDKWILDNEDKLNDNITQTLENSANINLTKEMIEQEVVERKTQNEAILEETKSLVQQTSESWELIFTKLENDQSLTDSELNKLKTYFRVDLNGAVIGKMGNPITLHLINDAIEFRENNEPFATWKGRTMDIDNLIAKISIKIGTHSIEKYMSPYGLTTTVQWVD